MCMWMCEVVRSGKCDMIYEICVAKAQRNYASRKRQVTSKSASASVLCGLYVYSFVYVGRIQLQLQLQL